MQYIIMYVSFCFLIIPEQHLTDLKSYSLIENCVANICEMKLAAACS